MPQYAMEDYRSYLLYASSDETEESVRFGLPVATSVMETIDAELATFPTFMFGVKNNYAIDLGTSKRYQVNFLRVNPMEVHDDWTLADHEDAYAYWSNGHYIEMLTLFAEGWQNSSYDAYPRLLSDYRKSVEQGGRGLQKRLRTGGFHLHMEFKGPNGDMSGLEESNMRPDIEDNVFFYGGITVSHESDVQMMRFGIVFAVATMKSIPQVVNKFRIVYHYYQDGEQTEFVQEYPVGTTPVIWGSASSLPDGRIFWRWARYTDSGTENYRAGHQAPSLFSYISQDFDLYAIYRTPVTTYVIGRDEIFGEMTEYTSGTGPIYVLNDSGSGTYAVLEQQSGSYSAQNRVRFVRIGDQPDSPNDASYFTRISVPEIGTGVSYDIRVDAIGGGGAGMSANHEDGYTTKTVYTADGGLLYRGESYPMCTGGAGGSGDFVSYEYSNIALNTGENNIFVHLGRGGTCGYDRTDGTDTSVRLLTNTSTMESVSKGGKGGSEASIRVQTSGNFPINLIIGPGAGGDRYARGGAGMAYSETQGYAGNNGDNFGTSIDADGVEFRYGYGSDIGCPGGGSAQAVYRYTYKGSVRVTSGGTDYTPYVASKGGNGSSFKMSEHPLPQVPGPEQNGGDGSFGGGGGGAYWGMPYELGTYNEGGYAGYGGSGGNGLVVVTVFEHSGEIEYVN